MTKEVGSLILIKEASNPRASQATMPPVKFVYFAPSNLATSIWDTSLSCMQNSLMLSTRYWYGVALLANDVEGVRVVRRRQGRGGDLRKLQAEKLPAQPQHAAGLPQRHAHVQDVI